MTRQLKIEMNNFCLPIKISKDCDYYCALIQKLWSYCDFINIVQDENDIENLFDKVYSNCSKIKECLESYYNPLYSYID